jgi:hypothetical protein
LFILSVALFDGLRLITSCCFGRATYLWNIVLVMLICFLPAIIFHPKVLFTMSKFDYLEITLTYIAMCDFSSRRFIIVLKTYHNSDQQINIVSRQLAAINTSVGMILIQQPTYNVSIIIKDHLCCMLEIVLIYMFVCFFSMDSMHC